MTNGRFFGSIIRQLKENSEPLKIRLTPNIMNMIDHSLIENFMVSKLYGLKHVLMSKDSEFFVFAMLILTGQNYDVSFEDLSQKYKDLESKMAVFEPESVISHIENNLNDENRYYGYRFCERPWF
jgi:hypothetical protein